MAQKKLMILGASSAQLPIIHKAIELGCYVITVDNVPDNIGHQYSHQSVNCSTVDQYGILLCAQELNIDGIVTFASDIATTTVAFVAAHLRLTSCPETVAEIMANKANFRRFQLKHHLTCPGFIIALSTKDINFANLNLKLPLIFKPIDTSGSRGVTKVDNLDVHACTAAFKYAQSFSRSNLVSVEEFVNGVDVSGDGFLVDGQLCMFATQKYMRGFIPTGHSLPSHISTLDRQRIQTEVERTCLALGYLNGPIDFDVKIDSKQVVVIEMSARLGGNGIPELIRKATGVDLIELTIRYALGEDCRLPIAPEVMNPCGSWVFGADYPGKLENIASRQELLNKVPQLFDYTINYQLGDSVPFFEHSGCSLGYALFDCPATIGYNNVVDQIQTAMQLEVVIEDGLAG